MGVEIRRTFYFDPGQWTGNPLRSLPLEQGYLGDTGAWEIRLRRTPTEYRYTMTTGGDSWDTPVGVDEFTLLWARTGGRRITKVRDHYDWRGRTLKVDRYSGTLDGLILAEVGFATLNEARNCPLPRAFGPEVTYDPRFETRALAEAPAAVPVTPRAKGPVWSYGALPFRQGPQGLELVVVTTQRQDRWIFPKGHPEPHLSPEKVALAEAHEEAGITGKVAGHPFVVPYPKDNGVVNLLLFPVLVTGLAERWLELGQRERQVVPLERAEAYGEVVAAGARWLRDNK